MGSVNFKCFDACQTGDFMCCQSCKTGNSEEVMVYCNKKNITILSAQSTDVDYYADFSELQDTEQYIFTPDKTNNVRYALVSHHNGGEHKTNDLIGKTIGEICPEDIQNFLIPIIAQTLKGNYYSLCTLMNSETRLIRSFPVWDHNNRVIAAIYISSPWHEILNRDRLTEFVMVDKHNKRKSQHSNGKRPSLLHDKVISGILNNPPAQQKTPEEI